MNFEFSPAEQAFAEKVRGFLRAHAPETFPVDGMDAGYGLVPGWPGLLISAEDGGSGGSFVDVSLLIEEMGRACLNGHALVVDGGLIGGRLGSEVQQRREMFRATLGLS